jgi:opacity protein-like surface antigen
MWHLRSRACGLLVALAFADASPVRATPPDAGDPQLRFARGAQEWALTAGHGFGLSVAGSDGSELEDLEFVALVPRLGIGLTDPLGEASWWRGNLELLIEGALLFEHVPNRGFAGGGGLGLRYNFLGLERVVPFVEGGAGILGLDFDLDHQSDGLNFGLQLGAGLHYGLSRRTALTMEWLFHHISNAGIHEHNDGINDALLLIGVSYFPE